MTEFLYNNSYCIENKILIGTRGWNLLEDDNGKMLNREKIRLQLSIEDGIKKYGNDKEIIAFMHYPPVTLAYLNQKSNMDFIEIMKQYNIKKCYYGHLHGVQAYGNIKDYKLYGIEYKLISADYLEFDIQKIY